MYEPFLVHKRETLSGVRLKAGHTQHNTKKNNTRSRENGANKKTRYRQEIWARTGEALENDLDLANRIEQPSCSTIFLSNRSIIIATTNDTACAHVLWGMLTQAVETA